MQRSELEHGQRSQTLQGSAPRSKRTWVSHFSDSHGNRAWTDLIITSSTLLAENHRPLIVGVNAEADGSQARTASSEPGHHPTRCQWPCRPLMLRGRSATRNSTRRPCGSQSPDHVPTQTTSLSLPKFPARFQPHLDTSLLPALHHWTALLPGCGRSAPPQGISTMFQGWVKVS